MIEIIENKNAPDGFSENLLQRAVNRMIEDEGFQEGDLIFVLMSDEELLQYNKELLDHDYYTDIITMDQKMGNIISGELMISVDRIIDNAKSLDEDILKEFYRVLLHGVLHIIGYNDKTSEEKELMRERENFYLSSLSF